MPSTEEKLRLLRKDYRQSLPTRLESAAVSWRALEQQWNTAQAVKLHRELHSLAGSGATFGFPKLTSVAREFESLVKRWLSLDRVDNPDDAHAFIAALHASIAGVAEETASVEPGVVSSNKVVLGIDDPALSRALASQLEHFGFTVDSRRTLAHAFDQLELQPPCAVITEPTTDNFVALAGLRDSTPYLQDGSTLLMFISADDSFAVRLEAVRAGGHVFMQRSLEIDAIVERLVAVRLSQEQEPYRILLIEDDPAQGRHFTVLLQGAGMIVHWASDSLAVAKPLETFSPDLVLMDVYMPNCSGLELAQVIRQQETHESLPIVFLSSETDVAKQMAAMELGADDFLSKPINAHHLIAAINIRAARYRKLRALMIRDGLTGLLNHTRIKEQLSVELARAARQNTPVCFAMLDIDHFKTVNDSFGHPTGDHVLRSLSGLLQQRLRKTDIIGRYGGEEFAVVLPGTSAQNAYKVIDEIRVKFSRLLHRSGDQEFSVSFSAGLACYTPPAAPLKLVELADAAMYQAKRGGRNKVVFSEQA